MWAAIRHFLVQPWLPKEMGQQVVKLSLLDTDLRVVNQTFTSYELHLYNAIAVKDARGLAGYIPRN